LETGANITLEDLGKQLDKLETLVRRQEKKLDRILLEQQQIRMIISLEEEELLSEEIKQFARYP
jgi:hypothetical protein